jgi:hypothetical protein
MSQRVWVNPFPFESIYPLGTCIDVLFEQIPNSEPGEFGTPSVCWLIPRIVGKYSRKNRSIALPNPLGCLAFMRHLS